MLDIYINDGWFCVYGYSSDAGCVADGGGSMANPLVLGLLYM
jgi:hypothetical protein